MSLRQHTPCDERDPITGLFLCPYCDGDSYVNCEYWCGAEEPEDRSMEDEQIYVYFGEED